MKKYNNIIKKGLIKLILIGLLVPFTINAVSIGPVISKTDIASLIEGVIDFIFTISIPIAAVMLVLAGYFFITSAGNPEKIITTKKLVFYILIGLLIVFLAKGLITAFKKIIEI